MELLETSNTLNKNQVQFKGNVNAKSYFHTYLIFLTIILPDCQKLNKPENGLIKYINNTHHGSIVTILCNTNYTLTGNSTLLCHSGNWSNTVGTCEKGKKLKYICSY